MCPHLPSHQRARGPDLVFTWLSQAFGCSSSILFLSPQLCQTLFLGTPNSCFFSSRHESGWAQHLEELSCSGSTGTETCLHPGGYAQSLNLSWSTSPRGQGPKLSLVPGALRFSSSLLLPLQSAGLTGHKLCGYCEGDPVSPE